MNKVWKKCLPSPPKMKFWTWKDFVCAPNIWAMCFLQKTALNLVKCGLHSRTYYFLPDIGGSHPVLYFTIQATEKYSNSNVLSAMLLTELGNVQLNYYLCCWYPIPSLLGPIRAIQSWGVYTNMRALFGPRVDYKWELLTHPESNLAHQGWSASINWYYTEMKLKLTLS